MIIETIDVTPPSAAGQRGAGRLLGSSLLLARRRAWRDRGLLLASTLIVALASALALAGPTVIQRTLDDGAKDAVAEAGDDANIIVSFPVGNTAGDNVNSIRGTDPAQFSTYADNTAQNLPGVIAPLVEGHVDSVVSRNLTISQSLAPIPSGTTVEDPDEWNADEHPDLWVSRIDSNVRFAMSDDIGLTLVEGRMPVDATGSELPTDVVETVGDDEIHRLTVSGEVIEVAVTGEVAEALDVELGSILRIQNSAQNRATIRIVGIVEPSDEADPEWASFPEAIAPVVIDRPDRPIYRRAMIVVSSATTAAIADVLEQPFDGRVELLVGSTGLTLQGARDVSSAMTSLASTADTLVPAVDVTVSMTSGLGPALAAYPNRAHAALAQMSVIVAGVIGVAALVVALMARLLLSRRSADIALERARGAAVGSVAFRLALESAIFTVAGVALGYVVASVLVGTIPMSSGPLVGVVLVSLVASPALGTRAARRMWTSKRVAANRQDRAKTARIKNARRFTLEALAVVLAGAAVVTLRGRGVLQTHSTGIDPFLAAAPILLALGIVVIILRLYPIPMGVIQWFAKRTRGVAGVITLAKSRAKIPLLPLLGLSLAISIAVSGGLLISTVKNGQEQASWERVGGEIRVDGYLDDATVAALEGQGLEVSRLLLRTHTVLDLGTTTTDGTLIAIDDAYVDVIADAGLADPADLRALMDAAATASPADPIPGLLSPSLARLAFTESQSFFIGGSYEKFDIVGDSVTVPSGWTTGPYLIVPVESVLAKGVEGGADYDIAFVSGDGAEDAVLALGVDPEIVVTRAAWLEAVSTSALIGGVDRMMTMSVIAVALLTAVALLVTILEGVRERGLALSMLRTQGMSSRYGWWLALTELGPLTIAGVIGGSAAGLAVLGLLGHTLGLEILAGGVADPPLVADIPFLLWVGVGVLALLFAAVTAEVVAHRRNKLSEVLRLGETR